MPELPDVTVYLECLEPRVVGEVLEGVRLGSPFLLRTVEPKLDELAGRRVARLRRVGKRLVFELEEELFLVLHLMIAGRLAWKQPGAKLGGKATLGAFDFAEGSLLLTEAGSKRRASLHAVRGTEGLAALDLEGFVAAITARNHTLKRALSRLLKSDWPRTLEELEERRSPPR